MNEKKEQERRIALRIFAEPCVGTSDPYHAGNCGACCLRGDYKGGTEDGKGRAPNYSGWARLYVQAGRTIPVRFARAFAEELGRTDNYSYVAALRDDIEYFGVVVEGTDG